MLYVNIPNTKDTPVELGNLVPVQLVKVRYSHPTASAIAIGKIYSIPTRPTFYRVGVANAKSVEIWNEATKNLMSLVTQEREAGQKLKESAPEDWRVFTDTFKMDGPHIAGITKAGNILDQGALSEVKAGKGKWIALELGFDGDILQANDIMGNEEEAEWVDGLTLAAVTIQLLTEYYRYARFRREMVELYGNIMKREKAPLDRLYGQSSEQGLEQSEGRPSDNRNARKTSKPTVPKK
jgi:hypothetical protein